MDLEHMEHPLFTSGQSISPMSNEHTRVLYTFRRCPYAIRARMAIFTAGIAFKRWLDKYKYADRHLEHEPEYYQHKCTNFLAKLDNSLQKQPHLITSAITLADIAIFPFVRQFSKVDRDWFDLCDFKALRIWLDTLLELPVFKRVMASHVKTHE